MEAEVIRLVPFTDDELRDIQLTSVDKMMELNRNLKANSLPSGNIEDTRKEIERLGKVVEKCSKACSK